MFEKREAEKLGIREGRAGRMEQKNGTKKMQVTPIDNQASKASIGGRGIGRGQLCKTVRKRETTQKVQRFSFSNGN